MRWLVPGMFADPVLRTHNLAQPVVILQFQPFLRTGHSLVTRSQELPRILLPGIEGPASFPR